MGMQRILMFKKLDEEDVRKIDALLMNEDIQYEISIYSKSLTIEGNNDILAFVKRTLLNNGFEII